MLWLAVTASVDPEGYAHYSRAKLRLRRHAGRAGALASRLRAAGYDASWHPGIADWDLIRIAQRQGRMLLTSDTGIFCVGIVRDREIPALLVPHGMAKKEQLRFVLRELSLAIHEPRSYGLRRHTSRGDGGAN